MFLEIPALSWSDSIGGRGCWGDGFFVLLRFLIVFHLTHPNFSSLFTHSRIEVEAGDEPVFL